MRPAACLVLATVATAALSAVHAITYGGTILTSDQASLALDKAAAEMTELRAGDVDCGVVLETISAASTPSPDASTMLDWLPETRTRQWPSLVSNVNMATNACHGYYDCLGVAVFATQPAATHPTTGDPLFVVRYMDRNAGVRSSLHDTEGTDASGGLWTATHIWKRTAGYACASDFVDATWYRNAWQSRLSDILPTAIPLSVSGAEEHFKTVGHLWRLWPNEHCKLTPVLLGADSDCTVLRCPTHTICPAGYRLKDQTSHWCTVDAGPEQTYAASGTSYSNSYMASNGGAYVVPPCTFQAGKDSVGGECGYDLTVLDASSTIAKCHCNPDVPEGDEACQFVASQHCRGYRESTGRNCNGEGVCRLDLLFVDWDDDALALGLVPVASQEQYDDVDSLEPPIRCHCDTPESVKAPWCDRSICSGPVDGVAGPVDCHTDPVDPGSPSPRSGTCARVGDAFQCVCNDLYFGERCQYHDAFDPINDSPTGDYLCFIEAADVGVAVPGKLYLECAGHGTCHAPRAGVPLSPSNMECECASTAYNGTWCQHTQCPDCGPYGKCVQLGPDESPTGDYETMCLCAVHEQDPATAVAAKPVGAPLDGPCVVDLCLDVAKGRYGSLVVDTASLTSGGNMPPRGTCTCTVAGNGLRNEGTFCDEPVCERDAGGHECGIDLDAIKNGVCKACSDYPDLRECAGSVLPIGAVCDCDNDAEEAVPYWEMNDAVDRYTHDGVRGVTSFPVCSIYCKRGSWRKELGTYSCRDCFSQGYVGDRCEDAICVHGRYDPSVSSLCVPGSCASGWAGSRCDKCDTAFGLDDTLGDGNPGCDVCLAGWAHPEGLSGAALADLPANATCVPCRDVQYCHAPGTDTQTCAHDHAPTKFLCACRVGWEGARCDVCAPGFARPAQDGPCTPHADLVVCGAGATGFVVVLQPGDGQLLDGDASHCTCLPHFDVSTACAACAAGFAVVHPGTQDVACVPCSEALGCFPPGTQSAACPVSGNVAGACECFPGYAGDRCQSCAPGATWDADAQRCTACGLQCGPDGVPNCDAQPPVCMCFNGFGGSRCDTCAGCGPGGACSSGAFLQRPWCTCRTEDGWLKSVTAATPGATDTDIRLSPCDACAATALPVGPVCVPVAQLCGFGAHVVASHNAAACFCKPAFLPLSQQPSGKCEVCAEGGVGPDCEDCAPACQGAAHCVWRNTSLRVGPVCECDPGFVDSLLGPCSQCDAPAYQGAFCRPCPPSCGLGTCAVEALTQDTYCLCPAGSHHAVPGDPKSTCGSCAPGETPLSCRICPVCGANSVCTEDVRGDPVCACAPGHERAPGATRYADPCFREDELRAYMDDPVRISFLTPVAPVPATGLAAHLAALPSGRRSLIYVALPLFTLSMCCCGCFVWSFKARIVRASAARRAATVRGPQH